MKRAYSRDTYLYAEFHRVARYLMAEAPSEAESHAVFPWKEIEREINVESSVIRMVYPGAPHRPAYMIFHRGTPHTTSLAPQKIDGRVIDVEIPRSKGMVLRHLRRTAKLLRCASPEMFEIGRVASSLADIEAWCGATDSVVNGPETVIPKILGQLSDPSLAPKNIVDGAGALMNIVMSEFMWFRVPGSVGQKVEATFSLYPFRDLLKQVIVQRVVGSGRSLSELNDTMFVFPSIHIAEYLVNPSLGGGLSFTTAREAARLLSQKGRGRCLSALSAYTISEFHNHLYAALFYYRGALEIYAEMKLLAKRIPTICDDYSRSEGEIHRCWVEAEEMRVTICASLSQAALTWRLTWNIARPYRLFRLVVRLIAREGTAAAVAAVRDLAVRLVCPKFVQDMLLAFIAIQQGDGLELWRSRIETIISELEVAMRRCILQGEPAYLEYAYTIAADLAEKSGDMSASAGFAQRRERLPAQLGKFPGGAKSLVKWQPATPA
jgi:hypothetical protein